MIYNFHRNGGGGEGCPFQQISQKYAFLKKKNFFMKFGVRLQLFNEKLSLEDINWLHTVGGKSNFSHKKLKKF